MEPFSFLFYGSMLLISEARLAPGTVNIEMDFVWKLSKNHIPEALVEQRGANFARFRRREEGK